MITKISHKDKFIYHNGIKVICSTCNGGITNYRCSCGLLSYDYYTAQFSYILNEYYLNYHVRDNDYSVALNDKCYYFNNYCILNKSNEELLNKLKILILL